LTLDWEALSSASDPDQQIIIWTAEPGSRSHDRLRELAMYARERDTADPTPIGSSHTVQ
jgi:hypothetical protein